LHGRRLRLRPRLLQQRRVVGGPLLLRRTLNGLLQSALCRLLRIQRSLRPAATQRRCVHCVQRRSG